MLEKQGDLFKQQGWIAIPTNGIVKADCRLVMGAGVAKYARNTYKDIDLFWGKHVKEKGNTPCAIVEHMLISFPTKHHYKDPSSMDLIKVSALLIKDLVDKQKIEELHLPRVGCGLGGLMWNDVHDVLNEIFDNRFIAVS